MPIVKPLTGHTSQETAYVQADYPYRFVLRCQRRTWIERDPSGRKGYRFCVQTSNPKKTELVWNAPKKSTYTMLAIMGLDEENHVTWTNCSIYEFDKAEAFVAQFGHAFDADLANDAAAVVRAYQFSQARKAAKEQAASA